jgi:DNA adenine methylase
VKAGLDGVNVPHPIPYQGSKRAIARHILSYIPPDTKRLVEPFAGSAAVSLAVACKRRAESYWLNDLNEPLANLWSRIITEPVKISAAYKKLWNAQHGNEADYYKRVRTRFNETQKPEYLLYLLARCVKAAVRYNANGEFNQSPDNRRKGMKPSTMTAQIMGASSLLNKRTKVTSLDFRDLAIEINTEDVVYMDPPYQGVSSNRDRRYIGSLDLDAFVNFLEALNNKGVSYIVSYDGRTGSKTFGKTLPASLNLEHEEIKAGKSSQATLLGRDADTYESLYLSPALIRRREVKPRAKQLSFSIASDSEPSPRFSEAVSGS